MDSTASFPPDDAEGVPDRFRVDFLGRTLLGTYRVERLLAEGGMGTVYLAKDQNLGRQVVVKVPHARFLSEPGFRARFRREIAELVRLEHAHVVRILARGEEDEIPYFVLPYLGGGSLEERLSRGTQSPEEAARWLVPIAATLDFVHARGVVHRDVKPGNILFDEQGHVLLSDFGVVKALERGEEGAVTDLGTAVGSPFYMAPEQALGREVGPGADQYALASTLYEALAGEPPFGRGAPMEVVIRKQQSSPAPLAERRPDVPPAVDGILRRALAADPASRFPDCGAFAEAFAGAAAPRRVEAAPETRGRRALPIVLALAVVAAVVGASTDWFGLAGPDPPPAPAAARRAASVVLVQPGAEPRRTYRFRLAPGTEDRFTLRAEDRSTRDVDGRTIESGVVRDQDVSVRVDEVSEDGRARLSWRFERARTRAREGTLPALAEAERRIYEAIPPVDIRSAAAASGAVSDLVVDLPEGPEREAALQAGVDESVRQLEVEFPLEPIGLGAIWDLSRSARYLGMRFHGVATFELLSVEGDRVRLRFQMHQSAPDQKMTVPGQPGGFETSIESFRATARGEILLDLARPAPVEHESKGTVEFDGTIVGGPIDGTKVDVDSAFDLRLVRE